ncbi:DUF6374 family protein [Nocardia sp. NBC_00403]|uniref:DUF6374 family protein n=1 Tax=Nocardia sp. NBC_00403 TaxID=2975990 RepID=UPI003FA568FA
MIMPELSRLEWARMNLDQVRTQLLAAACGTRFLTPEQLECAAGNSKRACGSTTRRSAPRCPTHP